MKKRLTYQQRDNIEKACFIFVQAILFVLVFISENEWHGLACLGCVINPFVYSLKFLSYDKLAIFTQIGLLFTVFSDLFLCVIKPQFKAVAMTLFAIAQICYFIRLLLLTKHKPIHAVIRAICSAGAIVATFLVLQDKVDYLSAISMFYYTNLILNFVYALAFVKKSPLFALGLFLFILCDTLIGIEIGAGTYLNINESSVIYQLTQLPFSLAWVFYIPSQACIALSLHKTN